MAFIRTVPVGEATGEVQTMYEKARASDGYVPNYLAAFSLRPRVWNRLTPLIDAITSTIDPRRYELVTTGVALALECSYCSLAHGKVLRDEHLGAEQTESFARDFQRSDITPAEKAVVAFAQKIALRARAITQEDVDGLRGHGLTDEEIVDVASAATLRCFVSKFLDSVGAEPEASYADLGPALLEALKVGRDLEQRP